MTESIKPQNEHLVNFKFNWLNELNQVNEFQNAFNFPSYDDEGIPQKAVQLRYDLIKEELGELMDAIQEKDFIEAVDALCDMAYVTLGGVITYKYTFTNTHPFNFLWGFSIAPQKITKTEFYSILHVIEERLEVLGIDESLFKTLFSEVHRSNMSKACSSLDEVYATMAQEEYREIPFDYVVRDGKYFIHKKENKKLVKSIGYSPAELTQFFPARSLKLTEDEVRGLFDLNV